MMLNEESPLRGQSEPRSFEDGRKIHGRISRHRFAAFAFAMLGLVAVVAMIVSAPFASKDTSGGRSTLQQPREPGLPNVPILKEQAPYVVPLPSEQDWCVPTNSKFSFFGTYRSPHHAALEGILFAPGRFQGTILSAQDDDRVLFHLVNMTYGNTRSPQQVPKDDDEYDTFDAFCTIYNDVTKSSACYAPKFFSQRQARGGTRCVKLELPSEPGMALCRQLSMAEFDLDEKVTMGQDVEAERWVSRLAVDGNPPNEYDGELQLFLRNATSDGKFKIALSHWLTSDDQSFEASFQLMGHEPWDPSTFPEIPEGCKQAIDITKLGLSDNGYTSDETFGRRRSLLDDTAWTVASRTSCPFASMHRHLILPSLKNHYE